MKARVSAFAIVVPDYDAALDFYVTRLGFTLIEDTRLSDGKRWVLIAASETAETRILLARAADDDQAEAIGHQTGGRVGFFLDVQDFESSYARMIEAGVHFEEEPRTEAYGKVAVWQDPWGNRWDLLGSS